MKKDVVKILFFEIILLIFLLLTLFASNVLSRIIIAIFITAYAFFVKSFIKKKGQLSINKKQVLIIMLVFSGIYLSAFYLLGLYFGFYKNPFPFSFHTILKYILPLTFIIVFSERIRSLILFQNAKITFKSKKIDLSGILLFVSMTLLDIIVYLSLYTRLSTYDDYLTLLGLIIFSSFSCNLLYNYISRRYGEGPVIVFRIVTILYSFVIPIIPDVFVFFRAFLRMIYPYFIYLFLESSYAKTNTIVAYSDKKKSIIGTTILVLTMASFVMLISCRFRYGILVIGSGSMTGTINKGDAVVFESYKKQEIEEGNIIIFLNNNDTQTIHRVVEIKNVNGEVRYFTKGDANDKVDDGYITKDKIIGVTNFKIKYIGYPTIWVRDLFSKK